MGVIRGAVGNNATRTPLWQWSSQELHENTLGISFHVLVAQGGCGPQEPKQQRNCFTQGSVGVIGVKQ